MRAVAALVVVAEVLGTGCDADGTRGAGAPGGDAAMGAQDSGEAQAADVAADDSAPIEGGTIDAADVSVEHAGTADAAQDAGSGDWHLTVYFTAVESYFSGTPVEVTGCLNVECSAPGDPDNVIGSFPSEFVDTVQAEGTGQVSSGTHSGKFLNWSAEQPGSGYWLDQAPRDAQGSALVAYVSAAAHPSIAYGTTFKVIACGVDSTNADPMDPAACTDLKNGAWVVRDRFEDDTQVRHLDLYIGLQDRADMNTNPHFVDQTGAITTLP